MELNVHTGKNDYRERFNNSLSRAPISDQAPTGSEFEVFNTPCCKDASFSNKPHSPFHPGNHYITVLNLVKSR